MPKKWNPAYSPWRHGGWYVINVRYKNGACGCVSNNYPDKKWRIACDDRRSKLGEAGDYTFPSRDAAARAEYELVKALPRRFLAVAEGIETALSVISIPDDKKGVNWNDALLVSGGANDETLA